MEKTTYSRRGFIGKCLGISVLTASGVAVISSCNNGQTDKNKTSKNASENPCDDLSDLSNDEIETRRKLGYVKKSTVPGSQCDNCRLYIPPKQGKECGGCLLFKGPVRPEGYCTQYEAKT